MTPDNSSLGRCPDCDEAIPSAYLLIEYETEAGEKGVFAECPGCGEVIAPT